MFRVVANSVAVGTRYALKKTPSPLLLTSMVREKTSHEIVIDTLGKHHGVYEEPEYNDAFMQKYITFFDREDIDSWEIRRGLTDLHGMDCIPEPEVVVSILKACRRLNDFALTVRYLESLKYKCGNYVNEIYPWMIQEIRPTLDELGVSTPEELGYDKPELACVDVFDM